MKLKRKREKYVKVYSQRNKVTAFSIAAVVTIITGIIFVYIFITGNDTLPLPFVTTTEPPVTNIPVYRMFPSIPDFGKITGFELSDSGYLYNSSTDYYYDYRHGNRNKNIVLDAFNDYEKVLTSDDFGYQFIKTESFRLEDGNTLFYEGYHWKDAEYEGYTFVYKNPNSEYTVLLVYTYNYNPYVALIHEPKQPQLT